METEFRGSKYQAAWLEAWQMPLPTLLFRIKWELGKTLGRHKGRYEPSRLRNEDVLGMFPLRERSSAGLLEYLRARDNVRFYFARGELPELRAVWQRRLPAAREKLLAVAEQICRHEFSFLGSRENHFAGEIDWHDELDGHGSWPRTHWSQIDIRSASRLGDIKRTWELNRTQFFVTLARAYVLTEDERYVRELCAQWRSWLEQNPSETGVNWYSNLECALRSASWMFALEMTLGWDGWEPELLTDIVRSLVDQHLHMFKDIIYSEYCIPNNHLLGDALGIALLSLYFPELEHSRRYRAKALAVMFREAPRQIHEDGVSLENAISYHRFVLHMYLLVGLLLEKNGVSVPEAVWQRLERMCTFIMHVRTPSGAICQYGDWDDGRTIVLDDSPVDDFVSTLCTGAARWRRADLKAAAGEFREEALWLLGPSAAGIFDELPAEPPTQPSQPHPQGGIYTWRSDWSPTAEFVLFKSSAFESHTHADNLMVLYSAGGKDWLVDRGTFTYNGEWLWRTYFRGSRAHNVVVVDGLGQALAHRAFRWLKAPRQQMYKYHATEHFGYAAGATEFRHLSPSLRHARSVLVVPGRYVLVLDALASARPHGYELLWHVAPGHTVRLADDGAAYTLDDEGANLWIHAAGTSDLHPVVVSGATDPPQGWHSRTYGHKEPAPTLVYRTDAVGPLFLATLLTSVNGSAAETDLRVSFAPPAESGEGGVRLAIRGTGVDERLCLPNPYDLVPGRFPGAQLWLESGGKRNPII
ncbi:MAG: heparinase II/III family protein [Planctomycetes bacterium]|nr:heparinase II/III family protein [Planctomycetota bacterium]